MHKLQPEHLKLKPDEVKSLVKKFNLSASQLPKIKLDDKSVPEGCQTGDILKIERIVWDKLRYYYRVVV